MKKVSDQIGTTRSDSPVTRRSRGAKRIHCVGHQLCYRQLHLNCFTFSNSPYTIYYMYIN